MSKEELTREIEYLEYLAKRAQHNDWLNDMDTFLAKAELLKEEIKELENGSIRS